MLKKENVSPVLNREDILKADDIQIERLPVPEWGGSVFVKGMTGAERDRFEAGVITISGEDSKVNMADIRAKLCAVSVCSEEGKKLFSAADIKELSKKSASALQKVFEVAQRLSGITDDDVDELAEGLEERPFEGSVSD